MVECDECQRIKGEALKALRLLPPLPIPNQAWTNISMNFIIGFPFSRGKNSILVVVDCLTKYAHFCALPHPYTIVDVTQHFLVSFYKLHGYLALISDCDVFFISEVWQDLFKVYGNALNTSSTYHPQSGGKKMNCQQEPWNLFVLFCFRATKLVLQKWSPMAISMPRFHPPYVLILVILLRCNIKILAKR